jgi:phage repressor protein C with HTH and peptisase S24 domain
MVAQDSVTLAEPSSVTLGLALAACSNAGVTAPLEDPLVEALRRLCDDEGGPDAVAARAGVSAEYLTQILKGVQLPSGNPRRLGSRLREKLTSVYPEWLSGMNTLAAEPRAAYKTDVTIPQYATGGAMGGGLVLRDQPGLIHSWRVTPEWIQKNVHSITSPSNLAIVTGFGDSMRPLYNPGDPLLVDRGVKQVDFDGIYFFRIGNEGFIKRLQRIPGVGLRAISENKAYEAWDIREGMDFEVFARVVKVWRGEDF